ncbi:phosphatidylglycerol lysyltransferase domain-containing protein [uncultured Roseobacter sp.]|uniref:phosphatidylglycerol lysyltransferase domain-containing protein n=1 Tax=uncultured Roseobacter sp. TaxID=114847 RepID=UPI0026215F02|nr:phosphatidylglycerol lysyltransferase domain-containing protein [uncultured Roseobacter sp.]
MISLLPAGSREVSWDQYNWLSKYLSILPKSEDSIAHSAAYFLHTGRKGLFLVRHCGQVAFVASHPNIDSAALVLPAGGHSAPKLWAELCQRISSGGMDVTLARITSKQATIVEKAGCFQPVDEVKLDWRYPVVVLDTKKLSEMNGGTFAKYRHKVRRAFRNAPIMTVDQWSPIYVEREKSVLHMIKQWAIAVSEIKDFDTRHLISSNLAAYYMGKRRIDEVTCRVYLSGDKVIGFCSSEMTRHGRTANGIAMCLDRNWVGCSEYMYWNEAKLIRDNGYDFYNINGSETASLDSFRSKLRPHDRIPLQTFRWMTA